jgi:hypothetical protein
MNYPTLARLSYGALVLGAVLGALGLVREGVVLIALGTAGVSVARRSERNLERYLPLALGFFLLALAIVIPAER